jgi:predicted DNA-binding transcriptional regulator AlpA
MNEPRKYLTAKQVRERYGNRSEMWLWRKLKHDSTFPRPLVMGRNVRLFDIAALDSYDDGLRSKARGAE